MSKRSTKRSIRRDVVPVSVELDEGRSVSSLHDDESSDAEVSSREASADFAPKPKRQNKSTDLTQEEEDEMVQWLRVNACIYNKKLASHKDKQLKDMLWEEKAMELGKSNEMLQLWYRSMRTRYSRISKRVADEGLAKITERDHWVLTHMDFLRDHIYEVRSKKFKRKKAAVSQFEEATAADLGDSTNFSLFAMPHTDDDMNDVKPTLAGPYEGAPVLLPVEKHAAKQNEESDRLLNNVLEKQRKLLKMQQATIDMLQKTTQAPPQVPSSERTMYANWSRSIMHELDSSLWRRFQIEHSQLLYKYLALDDDIKKNRVSGATSSNVTSAITSTSGGGSQAAGDSSSGTHQSFVPESQHSVVVRDENMDGFSQVSSNLPLLQVVHHPQS